MKGRVHVGAGALDDLADQRVAVGVRAARGQAEHDVTRHDLAAVDDVGLFHRADGEAGEVVFARRVHARHLRGLATDQCAAGEFAAAGDALDHVGGSVDVELAAGEVVEEEQRLGALHQDVVHTHRHQILANGVMLVQLEGKLELGADAIGTGHQHRLLVLLRQLEQRAKAADAAEHLGAHRALGQRLDAVDQGVAGIDVHARVAVGQGRLGFKRGGMVVAQDRSFGLEMDWAEFRHECGTACWTKAARRRVELETATPSGYIYVFRGLFSPRQVRDFT